MAEGQEDRSTEDLGEEASPFRLEELREKGQVSQSKEVTGLLAFMAAAAVCWSLSPQMGTSLAELMRDVFRTDVMNKMDLSQSGVLSGVLGRCLTTMGKIVLPVAATGFIVGALGSFAQVGSIFSFDPITPDFAKINPLSGLGRLFSMKHVMDSLSVILKSVVLITMVVMSVKSHLFQAPGALSVEPAGQISIMGQAIKSIVLPVVVVLAIFAGIDYFLNRREYMKQVRLTKQEAKQEAKERDGDPQIKARIRSIARDRSRRRMMDAVKKADVIITNPTHIAIAIRYDRENMAAPKVVAKGADFLAQKIKQLAADAGVPMVENVPLARTLYKTVKVGQGIPRALYQAVAEVLAYVYRLKGRGF